MSNSSARLDINVLPDHYRKPFLRRKQILFILALVTLLALVVPLYQLVMDTIGDTSLMNSQLTVLNQQKVEKMELIADRDRKLEIVGEFDTINDERVVMLNELDAINNVAKDDTINVTSIQLLREDIHILCKTEAWTSQTGWSNACQKFTNYGSALEQTGRFTSVRVYLPDYKASPNATIDIER